MNTRTMDLEKEREKLVKELEKHVVSIKKYDDDLTILDFYEPGTNIYSVRYIFDKNKMYISGDIGYSIFNLTWKATEYAFNEIRNIPRYYLEKLVAHSGPIYDFDQDVAFEDLTGYIKEKIEENEEGEEKIRKLNLLKEFSPWLNTESYDIFMSDLMNSEEMNELIGDEWKYDTPDHFGKVLNLRYIYQCLFLTIACEKLHPEEFENGKFIRKVVK